MKISQNKYIYLLAISTAFILMPFFFGFPQTDGNNFYLENHGAIQYVSAYYYFFSLISYGMGILGIILSAISLIKLQRDYGFKPRIILVLMDTDFFRELFSRIKRDSIAIIIFSIDVILLFTLLFFRW